ncbi:hypothetical protein HDV03_002840 [Kappamyces sp. JEL0829]|nr:hypothetical protein HDV03_002840 [Kappamyces sp. JEL0829]
MSGYIKVIFKGTVYGPIQAPTTLAVLANLLRVSMRAQPTLQSLDPKQPGVVCAENTVITSGIYTLVANPEIVYDEVLDGHSHRLARKSTVHRHMDTQTEPLQGPDGRAGRNACGLPMERGAMEATVEGMLHLISTIPPRYIKYNKLLSTQIETALDEVDAWNKKLHDLYADMESGPARLHASGVPLATFVTFVQYRVLFVMHDIWKKVWTRFAPSNRVFNVSKIYTLHTLEKAEHILNCLSSWRRMLDANAWSKIRLHTTKDQVARPSTAKVRLLMPARLPSDEHCGNPVQLAQAQPDLSGNNAQAELVLFRLAYLEKVRQTTIHRNEDLKLALENLLREKSLHPSYPAKFIRQAMAQEFRIAV